MSNRWVVFGNKAEKEENHIKDLNFVKVCITMGSNKVCVFIRLS